jgi:hypothetical protein
MNSVQTLPFVGAQAKQLTSSKRTHALFWIDGVTAVLWYATGFVEFVVNGVFSLIGLVMWLSIIFYARLQSRERQSTGEHQHADSPRKSWWLSRA